MTFIKEFLALLLLIVGLCVGFETVINPMADALHGIESRGR